MSDSRLYWVGFNLVKGIGAARLRTLLAYFGDAEAAWQAPEEQLRAAGLSFRLVENLVRVRRSVSLPQLWEKLQARGIQVITWDDPTYPRLLANIEQPPPVLYLRGTLEPADELAVAIVGTRRVTAYGKQAAGELASCLAAHGITVVSGLARGVDTCAHQTALNNHGRTLAVLGCGVDIAYPPENQRLAEAITQQGALMSDYPPGTPPEASNFPPRNRIIAGLSRAVVVVEAGETSGALITATFAEMQGRPVYALPGSIYAPQSKGSNRLLQKGARILLSPEELVNSLQLKQAVQQRLVFEQAPANATEARLLALLGLEPLHVDEIGAQTGLPIADVSAALVLMELKGTVRHVGGMNYVAVREPEAGYCVGEDSRAAEQSQQEL